MWVEFMAIIGAMWALQGIMTYFQIRNLRSTLRKVAGSGHIGLGTAKSRLGPGTIIILIGNDAGKIIDARIMTGMTVFSRFRVFPEIIGLSCGDPAEALRGIAGGPKSKSCARALTTAVENLRGKYRQQDENRQEAGLRVAAGAGGR